MSNFRKEVISKATPEQLALLEEYDASFWVCLSVSIMLAIAGFMCPPLGVIHGSVLTAMGILLAFYAVRCAWKGLTLGKEVKLQYHDATLAMGDGKDIFGNKPAENNTNNIDNPDE